MITPTWVRFQFIQIHCLLNSNKSVVITETALQLTYQYNWRHCHYNRTSQQCKATCGFTLLPVYILGDAKLPYSFSCTCHIARGILIFYFSHTPVLWEKRQNCNLTFLFVVSSNVSFNCCNITEWGRTDRVYIPSFDGNQKILLQHFKF
jgi:hypothetical protein